jgi:hypothetical protein
VNFIDLLYDFMCDVCSYLWQKLDYLYDVTCVTSSYLWYYMAAAVYYIFTSINYIFKPETPWAVTEVIELKLVTCAFTCSTLIVSFITSMLTFVVSFTLQFLITFAITDLDELEFVNKDLKKSYYRTLLILQVLTRCLLMLFYIWIWGAIFNYVNF